MTKEAFGMFVAMIISFTVGVTTHYYYVEETMNDTSWEDGR